MKLSGLAAAFAVALTLASVAPAAACDRSAGVSERVRFDITTLTAPSTVDALHRRIVRAAERVCGTQSMSGLLQRHRCVRSVVDRAVVKAELAPLNVLHANLNGREKYSVARSALDSETARLVAEAAGGGDFGSAGTIAQPEDPVPQR